MEATFQGKVYIIKYIVGYTKHVLQYYDTFEAGYINHGFFIGFWHESQINTQGDILDKSIKTLTN